MFSGKKEEERTRRVDGRRRGERGESEGGERVGREWGRGRAGRRGGFKMGESGCGGGVSEMEGGGGRGDDSRVGSHVGSQL